MAENVTPEEYTKARKEAMDEYYDVPDEDHKTRELLFMMWGILRVGYMSYELFNMIKNKL